MDREVVIANLKERILEAQGWANEGFPGGIDVERIRKFPLKVEPVQFDGNPAYREEEAGVRFRLSWKGSSGAAWIELDLVFAPEGRHPMNIPYLAFYVHMDEPGDDDFVGVYEIGGENLYPKRTIQEFFNYWIQRLVWNEECVSRIMRHKIPGKPKAMAVSA